MNFRNKTGDSFVKPALAGGFNLIFTYKSSACMVFSFHPAVDTLGLQRGLSHYQGGLQAFID